MYPKVKEFCDLAIQEFGQISAERKQILSQIAAKIKIDKEENRIVNLLYVCTHNSRRSHFGQVWAAVAAAYFGVENTRSFSGGTEATAFNQNAINALLGFGFEIKALDSSKNPVYEVHFGEKLTVNCFSKRYDSASNPCENLLAIMTCGDAEANCPYIAGVAFRIATTYKDPKAFDGTVLQDFKYSERCLQIATETLFVFSLV
jgi:arsenate reductase (thioredoxin)